jgi:hypothetical protein
LDFISTISAFYPDGGNKPRFLDEICGLSSGQACAAAGPTIKVHVQQHPYDKTQYVVVTVLEDYLSPAFRTDMLGRINQLGFQLTERDSTFLRVSTNATDQRLITFGNTISSARQYEATNQISDVENGVLRMTKYLYSIMDSAEMTAISAMEETLRELDRQPVGAANDNPIGAAVASSVSKEGAVNFAGKKRKCKEVVDRTSMSPSNNPSNDRIGREGEISQHPVVDNEPLDMPNSLVIHASKNKPYLHHNDAHLKPFCCNNSVRHLSEDMMRIATQGLAFALNEKPVPDKVISIKHGFPAPASGGNDQYCILLGCFSSVDQCFVPCQDNSEGIVMGKPSHLHIQGKGSQRKLHHFITPLANDVGRIVISPRRLQAPTDERNRTYFGRVPRRIAKSLHIVKNVVKKLKGEERVIPSSMINPRRRSSPRKEANGPHSQCRSQSNRSEESYEVEGCVTHQQKQSGKNRKQSEKKCDWMLPRHSNGEFLPEEVIAEEDVLGIKSSYQMERIARSRTVVEALCKRKCSLNLKLPNGKSACVGPMTRKGEGDKEVYLLKRGDKVDPSQLDAMVGITSNDRWTHVINAEVHDIYHTRHFAKNTSSLMREYINAKKGNGEVGVMWTRGTGGAIEKGDQYDRPCSHASTGPGAPNVYVSSGQKHDDPQTVALQKVCLSEQVLNVFHFDTFLGLFVVEEVVTKKLKSEEAKEEVKMFKECLVELHELDNSFPAKITIQMDNELSSIRSPGHWFKLVPVLENLWKDDDEVAWNVQEADLRDFLKPRIEMPKKTTPEAVGVEKQFCDVESVLSHDSELLRFLTEAARKRLFPQPSRDGEFDQEVAEGSLPFSFATSQTKDDIEMKHVVNSVIHSAAMTLGRACDPSVVVEGGIVPPRAMLEDFARGEGGYGVALEATGLKSAMTNPIHPPYLGMDTSGYLAMKATNSFDPKLQEMDDNSTLWINRNGKEYILSEETAEESESIFFKCVVCAVTSPSALLQIHHHLVSNYNKSSCRSDLMAPNPDTDSLEEFLCAVSAHKWNRNRVVHPIFVGHLQEESDFASFLRKMAKAGRDTFTHAVKTFNTRPEIVEFLVKKINQLCEITLGPFEVHHIMRLIELCIHDAFGEVKVVPLGHGSEDVAKWLRRSLPNDGKGKVELNNVPQAIVDHFNARARGALSKTGINKCDGGVTKIQLESELTLLGLTWSTELDCLRHKSGIGKRFDASDAEHALCMVQKMYHNTWKKPVHMDGAKYFPIRSDWDTTEFMKQFTTGYDKKIVAYHRLLEDKSYDHRNLHCMFRCPG